MNPTNFLLLPLLLCLVNGSRIGRHSLSENQTNGPFGIINGKKTSITKYPFTASLLDNGTFIGSGVIINKRWILTTAFNVKWVPAQLLTIRVGSVNYDQGGQTLKANLVIWHQKYTGSWDYDIAVIKVNKPIRFGRKVKAAHLGTNDIKGKSKVVVVGWGPTKDGNYPSKYLLYTDMMVLDWKTCKKDMGSALTPRIMCTAGNVSSGPCEYDFGDPLISGKTVYGLFVGGMGCLTNPALYANVPALYKWIEAAIRH